MPGDMPRFVSVRLINSGKWLVSFALASSPMETPNALQYVYMCVACSLARRERLRTRSIHLALVREGCFLWVSTGAVRSTKASASITGIAIPCRSSGLRERGWVGWWDLLGPSPSRGRCPGIDASRLVEGRCQRESFSDSGLLSGRSISTT